MKRKRIHDGNPPTTSLKGCAKHRLLTITHLGPLKSGVCLLELQKALTAVSTHRSTYGSVDFGDRRYWESELLILARGLIQVSVSFGNGVNKMPSMFHEVPSDGEFCGFFSQNPC